MSDKPDPAKAAAKEFLGPHYNEATEYHQEIILVRIIREKYAPQQVALKRLVEVIRNAPTSEWNRIQFEGRTVCAVSPEDLDDLHQTIAAVRNVWPKSVREKIAIDEAGEE